MKHYPYPAWLDGSSPRAQSPRKTFAVVKLWAQEEDPVESGLLGPVVLKSSKSVGLD